jgi:ribosomal 30S subunit maturation factor RimM
MGEIVRQTMAMIVRSKLNKTKLVKFYLNLRSNHFLQRLCNFQLLHRRSLQHLIKEGEYYSHALGTNVMIQICLDSPE